MIRDTITTINSRITAQLLTPDAQVAGMAVPFYDQQEKTTILRLADEPKRLTLDGGLRWQSAHLTNNSRVTNTQTFGSFTDHTYDVGFVLIGVSKAKSGKDVALRSLDGVGYVVIDSVEDDALNVLSRYWKVKTGPDKNYDPDLWAWAITYHIEGVCDEDYADLPGEQDLAELPVLLAEPETLVIVVPGDVVPRSYRHAQGVPASLWIVEHNMGVFPASIHVEDTAGNDWIGEVTYVDTNNLTIDFGTASFAGYAYLT